MAITAVTVTDFDGDPVEVEPFEVGTRPPPRRAAGPRSCAKVSEQPEAVANTLLGRVVDGRCSSPSSPSPSATTSSAASVASSDRVRHGRLRGHGRQVRHRAVGARARRGRAQPRVPVPRAGARRRHARGLDQPVGRDHGHLMAVSTRARWARARSRSATRRAPRSRASPTPSCHARRTGGRRRVDEGLRRPDRRPLPVRSPPRPRPRHALRARALQAARRAAGSAREARDRARPVRPRRRARPMDVGHPLGALPGATWATRSRSRAR